MLIARLHTPEIVEAAVLLTSKSPDSAIAGAVMAAPLTVKPAKA